MILILATNLKVDGDSDDNEKDWDDVNNEYIGIDITDSDDDDGCKGDNNDNNNKYWNDDNGDKKDIDGDSDDECRGFFFL